MCHAGSRTHSRDRSFAVLGYETCCRLRCVSWMNYIHAVGVYRRPICLIEAAMQSDILIPSPSVLAVFCNSLLCGVSDRLVRKLQSIENAASRLIIGARRCDHIMHTLHRLHWLHRSVHWRRFYFQLTRVHSVLELFEWCALQIYLLTTSYLVTSRLQNRTPDAPVAVWSGTGIFSWWHQPCRRQWPPPSPVNSQQDVCCPIYRVAQKSKLLSQYNSLLFLSYPVGVSPGVPPDNRKTWPLWRAYMQRFSITEISAYGTALIRQSVNPLCLLQTLNLIATQLNADILQISM